MVSSNAFWPTFSLISARSSSSMRILMVLMIPPSSRGLKLGDELRKYDVSGLVNFGVASGRHVQASAVEEVTVPIFLPRFRIIAITAEERRGHPIHVGLRCPVRFKKELMVVLALTITLLKCSDVMLCFSHAFPPDQI